MTRRPRFTAFEKDNPHNFVKAYYSLDTLGNRVIEASVPGTVFEVYEKLPEGGSQKIGRLKHGANNTVVYHPYIYVDYAN